MAAERGCFPALEQGQSGNFGDCYILNQCISNVPYLSEPYKNKNGNRNNLNHLLEIMLDSFASLSFI